jgi:hypothetical protein
MIHIATFRHLGQFLAHPHYYSPSINSAHLERNEPALPLVLVLQKPVRVFLALHTPNHAPAPRVVGHGKGNGFRAVLGDLVLIVLFGRAHVHCRPSERPGMLDVFDADFKAHPRRVFVPLKTQPSTQHHDGSHLARQPGMHGAQVGEIHSRTIA